MFAAVPGQAAGQGLLGRRARATARWPRLPARRSRGPRQAPLRARARRRAGDRLRRLRRLRRVRARAPRRAPRPARVEREGEFIRVEQIAELIADLSLKPFSADAPRLGHPRGRAPERRGGQQASSRASRSRPRTSTSSSSPTARARAADHRLALPDRRVPAAERRRARRLPGRAHEGLERDDADGRSRASPHGSVERALRLVADERGPRPPRALPAPGRAGIALHDRDAERAFVDVLGNAEAAAAGEVETDLARRRAELERTVPGQARPRLVRAQARRPRAREQARVGAPRGPGRARPPRASLRDLWVVASGAADVLWNSDRLAELEPRPSPAPDIYARLLERRRPDAQGSVSEHRPEARAAGDVCALRGGLGQCLGSSASSSAAAAGSTSSTPAPSSSPPATRSSSTPPAAPTSGGSSRAPDEVAPTRGRRAASGSVLRKATAADLERHRLAPRGGARGQALPARELAAELEPRHEGRRRPTGVRRPPSSPSPSSPRSASTFASSSARSRDRLGRRVELKQVSARDESRIVGGYGPCGRSLCCASVLPATRSRSPSAWPKTRTCRSTPPKISGCCGRLMCCLKYEHQVYVSFRKRAPQRGAIVTTPGGEGKVTELLAPVDSVTVDLGEGRSVTCKLAELGRRPAREGATHERDTHVVLNVPDVVLQPLQDGDRGRRRRARRRRRVEVDVAEQERRRRLRRRRRLAARSRRRSPTRATRSPASTYLRRLTPTAPRGGRLASGRGGLVPYRPASVGR